MIKRINFFALFSIFLLNAKNPFNNPLNKKPELVGVAHCSDTKKSAVVLKFDDATKAVGEGKEFNNWQVEKIDADKVLLKNTKTGDAFTIKY